MKKQWNVMSDDLNYEIKATYNRFLGKLKLTINNEQVDFQPLLLSQIKGFDVPIRLGTKEAKLQVIGKFMDLGMDGFFLDCKTEYKPVMKMPIWNWLFILFSVVIPFILRGAIPLTLAMFSIMSTIRVSSSPKVNSSWKFLICFTIIVFEWLGFGILIMLVS